MCVTGKGDFGVWHWVSLGIFFIPFFLVDVEGYRSYLGRQIRLQDELPSTPLTKTLVLKQPGMALSGLKQCRFIAKRLLAALENEKRKVDFKGTFVLHGSAVLAARNEERGLLYYPRDIYDFCVFTSSKTAFVAAVLGTVVWLLVLSGYFRQLFVNPGPLILFMVLALCLVFWFCLGWLRFERLTRVMRPLLGELNRQPYSEWNYDPTGPAEDPRQKNLAAWLGLVFSIWMAWRLLEGF